jgi:predicted lipid-binding transport protein (Tim44 family)
MPVDIVIYAVFAVGLVLWLKSVLGTRHGSERSRPNPFIAPRPADGGNREAAGRPPKSLMAPAAPGQLLQHTHTVSTHSAEQGLMEIARADRSFSIDHFVEGAQDAFVMIVEAFAAGNRDVLRDLLSDPVYRAFAGAIDARETQLQKASVEIHAVRRAEIIDARLDRRTASITVRFVTDETSVLRDAAGTVIEGNPDRVRENIDIWTFSRDLRSRDPAWIVSETREEQDGPLPDHTGAPAN